MTRPVWADGEAYEAYVGRWSRPVATKFVRWLDLPAGRQWLDVGCGTGVLTATVLAEADPARVTGVDPSAGFVAHARARVADARAAFEVADARALPLPDDAVDVVVSGLTLNFVPEPARAVAEIARVLRPAGVAAAYVWDYAEGMALMRHFWDAAAELDPAAAELDEGRRFTLCRPEALRALWTDAGLERCRSGRSTCRRCSPTSPTTGRRSSAGRGPARRSDDAGRAGPGRPARSAARPGCRSAGRFHPAHRAGLGGPGHRGRLERGRPGCVRTATSAGGCQPSWPRCSSQDSGAE